MGQCRQVDGQSHVMHSEEEALGVMRVIWVWVWFFPDAWGNVGRWTGSRMWCTARRRPWARG